MAFEGLTEKLTNAFKKLRSKGKLIQLLQMRAVQTVCSAMAATAARTGLKGMEQL